MLENVREFADWGPLEEDGTPDPIRKGFTFRRFVRMLQNLGYSVDWQALRASDYGAPTSRERLFMVARRDQRPIVWPEPTHGRGRLPYRTAGECIDWSIPCNSIAETLGEGGDKLVKRVLDHADQEVTAMRSRTANSGNSPSRVPFRLSVVLGITTWTEKGRASC
jgi:DNA (cytosine-5)-methyltransferase 1